MAGNVARAEHAHQDARASDGRAKRPLPALEPALSLAAWDDAERLFRSRRESIVDVSEPMVLVSQIQRSGGTLVNTLLDGHPELHVHPYELHIGHPTKFDWPRLDMAAGPDAWLQMLSESVLDKLFASGYRKRALMDHPERYETLPFAIVPSFLRHLFRVLCGERDVRTAREAIDVYLTALFNAWIDNQGLRERPKRWVAGFGPRVAWGDSRQRFFADYPDGRIVCCLRDPRPWYASASTFSGRYSDVREAMALWRRGASEIAAAKQEAPEQVFVLSYEALVTEPERVMRALAEWLGIAWHPLLLEPTFNRLPTVSNSSYESHGRGIRTESLDTWRGVLSASEVSFIESEAMALDAEVRALAGEA